MFRFRPDELHEERPIHLIADNEFWLGINVATFLWCCNWSYAARSTVTNLIEGHNGEVVGYTRVEASDFSHLDCTVDNLLTTLKEGRLLVHDSVPHNGSVVVMRLLPHQADATRGGVN